MFLFFNSIYINLHKMSVINDRLSEEKEYLLTLRLEGEGSRTAHRRKPEIALNLNQRGSIFADQTPTPTRFIRNCEEVGLFQDLQNVNPFDETFRRATEAVKNGQQPRLETLCCSTQPDDTLHTPNVFPMLPEPHIQDNAAVIRPDNSIHTPAGNVEARPPRKYNRKQRGKAGSDQKDGKTDPEQVACVSSKEGQPHYVIVNSHVTFKLPIPRAPVGPKVYMPNYFSTFSKNAGKILDSNATALNKKSLGRKRGGKRWSPNGGDGSRCKLEPITKNEIMERNRIAAVKTREKKKHYIAHLEKMKRILVDKTIELEQQLQSLQAENATLVTRIGKCHCSKSVPSQRDSAQQTDDVGSGQTNVVRQVSSEEQECARVTSMGGYTNRLNVPISSNAGGLLETELEKEVFYATLPHSSQLSCAVFEPTVAAEPAAIYSLRKPFKKRNLN